MRRGRLGVAISSVLVIAGIGSAGALAAASSRPGPDATLDSSATQPRLDSRTITTDQGPLVKAASGSAQPQCSAPSWPMNGSASLCIDISMLPGYLAGQVIVAGPHHFFRYIQRTTALYNLVPGDYVVRSGPVHFGPTAYYPASPLTTTLLSAGQHTIIDVEYADIVPDTTKVASASSVTDISGGPGEAATLTLTTLPPGLADGDILAIGVTAATPYGFLGKVTSITPQGTVFEVATVPASLYQALPRGAIDPAWTEPAQDEDVDDSGLTCGTPASLSVTGGVTVTPSGDFSVTWADNEVTTASAEVSETLTQQLQAAADGQASCTLTDQPIGPPVTFDPIVVAVGIVPIVLVPQLQLYLNADASTSASLSIGATAQVTATAGLDYAAGQPLTPVSSLSTSFTPQPPTPNLAAGLSASVGPTVTLLVDGVGGPETNFDGSLSLDVTPLASPAWALTGGLDAGAGLTIPLLDLDESDPSIISYSLLLASSPPVITTTSLAAGSVGTGYAQTLQASQGTPPYTWSVISGTLPPGLSLDSSTGAITGTPSQAGSYNFTVQVLDSSTAQLSPDGQRATSDETINISGTPPTTCSTTNGTPSLSLFPATVSGLAVTINGVVIAPPGTLLTGIDWNWGDGTTQTGCVYFPETHDYAVAGEYDVTVTTTFTNGSQLQASEEVSVP